MGAEIVTCDEEAEVTVTDFKERVPLLTWKRETFNGLVVVRWNTTDWNVTLMMDVETTNTPLDPSVIELTNFVTEDVDGELHELNRHLEIVKRDP